MSVLKSGDRVYLPFRNASGGVSTGMITRMEPARFRITWDNPERLLHQPRVRTWHKITEAVRFRTGNPLDIE